MIGVQLAWFGLFLILLQMGTMLFADITILVGVGSLFVTGSPMLSLKFFAWGGISLLIALLIGFPGKFLCLGVPEPGAQKLIVLSVVCDLLVGGVRWGLFSGAVTSVVEGLGGFTLGLASFGFFLAFLARMGDNVGAVGVRRYVGLIYTLFGVSFLLVLMMFVSPQLALLLLAIDILVSISLYTFTIYTLFRAMPLYIKEVKLGYTDPRESAEERERKERLERKAALEARGGGPAKAKPLEAPTGKPPEGALLYRVPKGLGTLHLAVKEGDRTKLEDRIARGDDPRETIRHGLTALHIAASCGVMEVADTLLAAGVPIDATCEEGLTALYMAVQTGNPFLVGLLLSRGSNIHHVNDHGLTPLHWACCAPHPNLEGPTRVKMVDLLLEHGADLSARTREGKTPRDLAVENGLEELVSFIDRKSGHHVAPVESRDSEASGADSEVAPTNFKPFTGARLAVIPGSLPPLHEAVKDGDPEKVYRQLVQGVSIKEPIAGGITPIHITAITGVMSVTDLLLQNGASVSDTCEHNLTPIFLAIVVNNQNMVGYLLSRKADVNHRDDMGRTPLHWAAAVPHEKLEGQNRVRMVKFLLDHGADRSIADSEGNKAADLARLAGQVEVAMLLEPPAPAAPAVPSGGGSDEYY